jgi:hypothetical protein
MVFPGAEEIIIRKKGDVSEVKKFIAKEVHLVNAGANS